MVDDKICALMRVVGCGGGPSSPPALSLALALDEDLDGRQ